MSPSNDQKINLALVLVVAKVTWQKKLHYDVANYMVGVKFIFNIISTVLHHLISSEPRVIVDRGL